MTPAVPSSFAIVVGLKFSDGGTFAFDQAARIAQQIPGATLHLVHVFENQLSKKESEAMTQHLKLYANEKAASMAGLEARTTGIHLRTGEPAAALVQFASDVDAGLIVLGAEKRGIKSWFATPTAEKVAATAACAVLVAGPKPTRSEVPEPKIEPPCPECLSARRNSGGETWWCARHSERAVANHTFSYQRELPFATRDSQLGPTGI